MLRIIVTFKFDKFTLYIYKNSSLLVRNIYIYI